MIWNYFKKYKFIYLFTFCAFLLTPFFTKPKIADIQRDLYSKSFWDAVEIKSQNLFSNLEMYEPREAEAKYVFRFTAPIIMKIFNLNRVQFFILIQILGFFTLLFWNKISYLLSGNLKLTILSSIAVSASYFLSVNFVDSSTPVNSLSYFLLTLALYLCIRYEKSYFLFILPLLFFNDERGAMAFGIIGIFIIFKLFFNQKKSWKDILFSYPLIGLISVFISCLLIRLSLTYFVGLKVPIGDNAVVGLGTFSLQWKATQIGFLSGVEGFVITIFLPIVYLLNQRKYLLSLFYSLIVITFMVGGLMLVTDMTKSTAYLIPLSLLMFYLENDFKVLKILLLSLLIVNTFFPTVVCVQEAQFLWHSAFYDVIWKILSMMNLS